MENYEAIAGLLLEYMKSIGGNEKPLNQIPVGISNRHVHLSRHDLEALFGRGYELTAMKELSQPGQYACKEILTLCGPKGVIEKVRILGPVRPQTQVEILAGDCFKLGVTAEARLSGDLSGTSGITLVGPGGSVQISEGVIIAKRHIHMLPSNAARFGVYDGQNVKIEVPGPRGGTFNEVSIRVTDTSSLEFHLDTEEANALGVTSRTIIRIVQ